MPLPPPVVRASFAPALLWVAGLLLWVATSTGRAAPSPASDATSDATSEQIAVFAKAFKQGAKSPKDATARGDAIALLGDGDGPQLAKALVDNYADVADELLDLQARKEEVDARIETMVKGQEFTKRTLDSGAMAAYDALCRETGALGEAIEALHGLQKRLLERAERLDGDPAVGWLVSNVIGAKKLPLSLKLFVARAAGGRGEPFAVPLMKALARATAAEELAVVLEGLASCGRAAQECAPTVLKALQHDDTAVREQAAWALAHFAAPEAIEPLIARLELESGRTQRRMGVALEILTGVQLGDSPRAWRDWLVKEGAEYVAGKHPLSKGRSKLADALSAPADPKKGVYYYGIPQEGKSIVYVIDCSGSMMASIKHPGGDGPPVDAGPDSRMEATKEALIEVLGKLTKDDKFAIVCFNDVVVPYAKAMTPATPAEIKKAQAWVKALAPLQTTNIHDALEQAFALAGRGAQDKYYKSVVDTIFLLTDGSPTKPDNTPDSTERILESVRRWNPTKHVVIHTIGIGKGLNVNFLQQIAKENGGRFVQQ